MSTVKTEAFRVALSTLIFEYTRSCTEEGVPILNLDQVCVLADLLDRAHVVGSVQKWALGKSLWDLLYQRDIVLKGQGGTPVGVERSETLDRSLPGTLAQRGENGEAFSPSSFDREILSRYQGHIKDIDIALGDVLRLLDGAKYRMAVLADTFARGEISGDDYKAGAMSIKNSTLRDVELKIAALSCSLLVM